MDKVQPGETPEQLAQRLLGDARMVHELMVTGWNGRGDLPEGANVKLSTEKPGPPSRYPSYHGHR